LKALPSFGRKSAEDLFWRRVLGLIKGEFLQGFGVDLVGFQGKRLEAATNLGEHGFREKFNHEDSTSLILRSSVLST
jgi:hypothetical protein